MTAPETDPDVTRDLDQDETRQLGSAKPRFPEEETGHDLPYTLLHKLGSGGMGVVYLARQEIPERLVALTLVSGGHISPEFLMRFESEYQVLAMMNHPGIAAVYDVGVTAAGAPYFTMEYVSGGLPITRFCEENQLPLPDRLDLFLQVCDGVLHAHQHAVVHRDLKPANVLVTDTFKTPTAKIIDFGIAKRMNADHCNDVQTLDGNVLGINIARKGRAATYAIPSAHAHLALTSMLMMEHHKTARNQ